MTASLSQPFGKPMELKARILLALILISWFFGFFYFLGWIPAAIASFLVALASGGCLYFIVVLVRPNRKPFLLGIILSVILFVVHMVYVWKEEGVLLAFLIIDIFMDVAKVTIFSLLLAQRGREIHLQHGQASVVYHVNSSPAEVTHYSIIHGPVRFPHNGFSQFARFWYNKFSWSHPWNLRVAYPDNPVILPTQEERVSVRISSMCTTDNKRLFLEIFIFFRISSVSLLIQTQCDPIDALRYHAKEDLIRKIQLWTFEDFMKNRPILRQEDFAEVYKGLIMHGSKIGVTITDVFCVDYKNLPGTWKSQSKKSNPDQETKDGWLKNFFSENSNSSPGSISIEEALRRDMEGDEEISNAESEDEKVEKEDPVDVSKII